MNYGQKDLEKKNEVLKKSLREIWELCEKYMPKSTFNLYEQIVTNVHKIAEEGLIEADRIKR